MQSLLTMSRNFARYTRVRMALLGKTALIETSLIETSLLETALTETTGMR